MRGHYSTNQTRLELTELLVHDYQQYLIKNPFGYRCHSATGIKIPR